MTWKITTDSGRCAYRHCQFGEDWCSKLSRTCRQDDCPLVAHEQATNPVAAHEKEEVSRKCRCVIIDAETELIWRCKNCGGKVEV